MIRRLALQLVTEKLERYPVVAILGPRQAGKTTLARYIASEHPGCHYFDLEKPRDLSRLNEPELALEHLSGLVVIDEIQRKENAGLFLKGLYDSNLPYKFIVTGSGSIELKEKIKESLAGRKRMFELNTVTFDEFLNYKTLNHYSDKLQKYCKAESQQTTLFLQEYLNYGGYPRIVTESNGKEKYSLINEIFSSYIEKDIISLLQVDRPDNFRLMIQLLAGQTGQLINHSQLAMRAKLSLPTLLKYIWYAEKTFIIRNIMPFSTNYGKEITKSPVIYFTDLGFRNFAAQEYGQLRSNTSLGFTFQNFVANCLWQIVCANNWQLHYWRTTDKAEIDFVIDKGSSVIPVEVKYSNFQKPEIPRAMYSFIEKYKPAEAWIINLNYSHKMEIKGTKFIFKPFYEIICESN